MSVRLASEESIRIRGTEPEDEVIAGVVDLLARRQITLG